MRKSTTNLYKRLNTAQSLLAVALTNTLALQNDSDEPDSFVASLDAIWLSFSLCCKNPYDDESNQAFALEWVEKSYGDDDVEVGEAAVQLVKNYFETKDSRFYFETEDIGVASEHEATDLQSHMEESD